MYARHSNDMPFLTSVVVEKERKQAEKDAKFKAKKAKAAASAPNNAEPKKKEKKEKKARADGSADDLPEYVEKTPVGQKKSMFCRAIDLKSTQSNYLFQYSDHWMMDITRPTYPKSLNLGGIPGGRKKATSNPSSIPMAMLAKMDILLSRNLRQMSLESFIWVTRCQTHFRIL